MKGDKMGVIVAHGQVEYVENIDNANLADSASALRIKVRLDSDGMGKSTSDLPYAFPLLPKVFQSVPKVGEGVFVLVAEEGRTNSQRYYIGPIISQPQYQEYCAYESGRGDAVSLLSGAKALHKGPLTDIARNSGITKGAFPHPNDVALIGRGQEDIVLKYRGPRDGAKASCSEIDLRAGIRLEPSSVDVKYLQGNVAFNSQNPAYVQVKYQKNGICGLKDGSGDSDANKYEGKDKRTGSGVVNIVADKINIISHQDTNQFGETICDNEEMVKTSELDDLMSKLHRSVYGDELIALLKKIVEGLTTHTHPYSMLPPTIQGTSLEDIVGYNYEKIVSPNVRIS